MALAGQAVRHHLPLRAAHRFSAAEGAQLHCEPMGRALFEQRVFDWLDARLASGPRARG
ncbi:hypothetical protein ACWGJW_31840 [Streptomyces nigrescens]